MPQARSPADTPPDASGRRPSLPSIYAERPQRLTAPSKSRRPRSAGTGAESTPPRKLNSKLSLLSLFKRSGADGSSSSVASGSEPAVNSPPSPIPIPGAASPASRPSLLPASPRNITLPLSSSPREGSFVRRGMEGSPGVRGHLPPASESSSRNRSASGASATSSMVPDEPSPEPAAAPVRPGILRMHNRSSSSGQGSSGYASSRIIRFESSSSTASLGGRHAQQQPQPESRLRTVSGGSAGPGGAADTIEEAPPAGLPMPPIVVDPADEDIEEEEEYGVPIDRADDGAPMQLRDPSVSSFALSISPSSPISPDEHEHGAAAAHFPFSIHLPPPVDDASLAEAQESPRRRESRLRGESVSSTSTDSNHPPSSASDATRTSNGSDATWMSNGSDATWTSSGSITTPTTPHSTLPLIAPSSPSPAPDSPHRNGGDPGPAPRRARVPSDIDIHAISSHAQAEALVARTEQSILNLEQYLEEHTRRDAGTGRTPLSAKLAAYGESLAIERRLKEEARRARAGGRVRASGSPDLDGRGGIGGRVRRGGLRNGARGGGDSGEC
ncbi:hypothetical protein BV22DRAFT_583683 [Leucogyrophana mollusca]|uniref:Uncharacterized protein n=1 Tax=Leucogyrophana mollusca TaxID=85980 RepID=A0ACB8BCN7_9AGAM|nr:hypothetical protein BV22DRAFT_583683 [Leucogyrophana mollusca]